MEIAAGPYRGRIASHLLPEVVRDSNGEGSAALPDDLAAEVLRVLDPAAAVESLHWGRNYLYRARLEIAGEALPVVVKQFRGDSRKERLRQRFRGSKGERSWEGARAMARAGLPTPEPVLAAEDPSPGGASFYVCRYLPEAFEARHLLRAARAGREAEDFPEVDFPAFLGDLGRLTARLHAAGLWHRDLSVGNVLLRPRGEGVRGELPATGHDLYLIDLNRMRRVGKLSIFQRHRDLSRLALTVPEHQELFLRGYWGDAYSAGKRRLFLLFQGAFELKGRAKRPLRGALSRLTAPLRPRRAHAHIPRAPEGASARDKVVWDYLSDQPHQHASRLEKLKVRLTDAPAHLESLAVLALAAPRITRRYRRLRRELYRRPVPLTGAGVAIRPYPDDPEALLAAVDDLGVRRWLLRLHPWQDDHDAEEELARELTDRGFDLAFALPQNRDLVRDPERWRRSVAELARRFIPYGKTFQVGQAINRSKWGVWRNEEYVRLARAANEELRRYDGARVLGPSVIDFEHHAVASVLNLRRRDFHFDGVSSLLYVDRRGAPENPQMGFDTVGKVVLLRAIADTSRNAEGRCWITEVNWPLREGPHSPAGKSVAVSEEAQADFLVRFYILALATGLVERVYWWQLVARGYGLIGVGDEGTLFRRPAYRALAEMNRHLEGTTSHGPLPATSSSADQQARLYAFTDAAGRETVVGWAVGDEPATARLPRPAEAVVGRDGEELPASPDSEVELTSSPAYFVLQPA